MEIAPQHHWLGLEPDPARWFGFVYLIVNNRTGQKYIGKKQYWFKRGRRKAGSLRRTMQTIDSGWRDYTGSSADLNADIAKYGKLAFSFYILSQYKNKGDLRHGELVEQVLRNAVIDPLYYNHQYEAVKFTPAMKESIHLAQALAGKHTAGYSNALRK